MREKKEFIKAIENCDVDKIKSFFKNGISHSIQHYNWAIRYSSKFGHLEIVKILLDKTSVEPTNKDNESISSAYFHDHDEII